MPWSRVFSVSGNTTEQGTPSPRVYSNASSRTSPAFVITMTFQTVSIGISSSVSRGNNWFEMGRITGGIHESALGNKVRPPGGIRCRQARAVIMEGMLALRELVAQPNSFANLAPARLPVARYFHSRYPDCLKSSKQYVDS